MKKGKTLKSRVLAWILVLTMVLSMMPDTALASGYTPEVYNDAQSDIYEQLELNESELTGNVIRTSSDHDEAVKFDATAYFYDSTYTCAYTSAYGGTACTTDGDFPDDRMITVSHPADTATGAEAANVTYKLASYEGNDCYKFTGSSTTATTMHLQTLGAYDYIYVLAAAGGVDSNTSASFKITLHYTDGNSQDETFTLYDWFTNKSSTNAIALYAGVKRGDHTSSSWRNQGSTTAGPYLLSLKIDSDATKLLSSISFERNSSTPPGVNCAVLAVTGAVNPNAPAVPNATSATNLNDNGTLSFTANWNTVEEADSYRIDVSTYSNFCDSDGNPSFVNEYNNYSVDGGSTTSCIISGLSTDVVYYYRVRAVSSTYGQSLSSNRILATLPKWVLDAGLGYDDVSYTETAEGAGTLTVKKNIDLTRTIKLSDGESVTIDLNGNTITAPDGSSAISAEDGAEVSLTIADNSENGNGKISGSNGMNEGESGSIAIDLSSAAAGSLICVTDDVTITGGNGADTSGSINAGAGGAAIAVSDSITVTVGNEAEIIGGNGGTATGTGNGGNGGAGISGSSNVVVESGGTVAGGNGGNAATAEPGAGGAAGTDEGNSGNVGVKHAHEWSYKVDDSNKNIMQAYCTQTENSGYCSYYGVEKALPLTLTASDLFYIGNSYNGAQLDSAAWVAAGLAVPSIYYEGIDGTEYEETTTPPDTKGTYKATVTTGGATASADFTIETHEHDGIVFIPWPENASSTTLSDGNYFLSEDVTLTAGVIINGNVNLCLNGHSLTINPSSTTNYKNLFYVNSGKTLSIYDCVGNGKITGGQGYYDGNNYKGGAIYLKEATLNLYGGSIEGNRATWGGAIFVDATYKSSTVNMRGGSIQNNTAAEGGGGIELENATSTLNMYGGSIVNNTVTNKNGGYYKGGGIHHLGILNIYGTSGDVQISGNTVAGVENNVYLRTGRLISIKGNMTENSRIGVSAYDVENSNKATIITNGYGSEVSATGITNFFMDGTHSNTSYALVHNSTELQIVPHSHAWNYKVNETETEVQAYCGTASPKCAYYGTEESHPNDLTLSLKAYDADYSGSAYNGASVTNDITDVTGAAVGAIEYYKDSEKLSSAPTDAGTYTAKVTIGSVTISREFTISKVDAACTAPTANTLTYDGTAQSLVSGGTATGGGMHYRLGTDGTWTTTVPTAANAGDYDVYYYVKGDSNHNSIGSEDSPIGFVKVTIGQKTLTEDMVSLGFIKANYTGSQFAPVVTVSDMSGEGESDLITANDYTVSGATEATEVGNYTITVTGKGNYTGSIQKKWSIIGVDFTASDISAENVTKTYTGEGYGISVSVTKQDVQGVQVRYKDGNGEYTLTECPTYSEASSTAYTIEYEVTAKGYNAYQGLATVTIDPKEVELEWSNTSHTYNGTEQKPTVNVKAESLCGNDICTVILGAGKTDSNAKAGVDNYSITVTGLGNSNYKLPSASELLTNTYTIAQKEVGIEWSNTEFTYDREAHKPTAALTGVVENDTCKVTVTGEQTNAGTNYTATASIDNDNYKLKASDTTTTFVINPKEMTAEMISLDDTDSIYDFTNNAITPVVTVKDGTAELTVGETGDYVLSGDLTGTAYGTYEIIVTGKGNYTGTPKVVWSITDPNAPTGEIILKENRWNSFLNDMTFGLFFKSTQQVTVDATDGVNESGVDKVSYCVSDTLLTSSDSLTNATWTEIRNGGSFNINPNARVYVYVKITDKAGNAAYISSKGIVVYTDAAQDTDKITYTRTSTEDVTASVTLNGNTVSKVANGITELTNGTHYTISADGATITFKASYLQTLSAGDYTINVSYKPMGENYVVAEGNDQPIDTSITLSVKRAGSEDADTKITNKDNLFKEYDGQPTEDATPSSKNSSTPKAEYKKKGEPDSSYTEEVPKDAGDYVVRVTYPQDENYEETSATEEFTISPKAVTAVVSVSSKTYDGTTAAEVTATVDTGIDRQTITVTGLTGTFDNKNAGTGKTVTINSTNTQVTAGEDTDAANYSITYPITATGNITAKTLNAVVSTANKVYDGTTVAEVTAVVETGIGEETLIITGLTGTFADQNVGTDKNVSIDSTEASVQAGAGTNAVNYTVVYQTASTASITARPVTLTWSSAELTYTGSEQEVTAEVSNKASSADSFTITYTSNKKTAVGEYTATVTDLGNSNYTLTGAEGITKDWSINYLVTDAKATPSGDTRNDSGWYTGTVTLTTDSGYRISRDGVTWSDTLTITDDGEYTVTYYLKDSNGYITDQKTNTIRKDSTAPAGEIKVGENSFTKFLNTITFGYFFKNTVDVKISGTDATSGIAKIEYQKVAKGETYNADGTWTAGKSFSMTANDKSVIYARIIDNAGNVAIINSDGIVVYTDATTSDNVEYTRTTKTDATSAIELNGNTVEEMRNGNTVLTEGTDYEIQNGRIVLKGEYLEKLPVGDYSLTVSYNPYGEVYGEDAHGTKAADSTITVTVKRADSESADTKITNRDNLSKEYDGQPTEEATHSSKNGSTPKVEYKKTGEPDSSYTKEVPKDAGDYVVRVTYPQDENYEETSATEEFTISPKAVTAVVSVSGKTYDGTTAAEVTATVDTGIDGQTITVTGLTGTFTDKNVGTDKTVIVDASHKTVTPGAGTKLSNYEISIAETVKAAITAKSITVIAVDAEKTYGDTDPALTYQVKSTTPLVTGESLSGITVTRAQGENAGTYVITASQKEGANSNYTITFETGTFTITNAPQDAPELTWQNETIQGKEDGTITGLTTDMEYRLATPSAGVAKETANPYTPVTDAGMTFAPGTYEVRYAAKKNYDASAVTTVNIGKGRMLAVTVPAAENQTGYTLETDAVELGWHGSTILTFTLKEGYSKTDSFAIKVNGTTVALTEGKYVIHDAETDQTITVEGVADITAPAGEIAAAENKWDSFLHTITFGLFLKETQSVSITATDFGSGLKNISYYVANEAMSEEEVKAVTEWSDYIDSFSLDPNNKYVVYAKLTDNDGNTAYISSDGLVLDDIVPVINGITDGKTYCGSVTFTITEENPDTVMVDQAAVTADADGKYTIAADNREHTIEVTDRSGNISAMIITVNNGHTYGAWTTVAEPTCTEKGLKKRICQYCGTEDTEEIAALGHTPVTDEAVQATCTTTGLTEGSHCLVCGEVLTAQETTEALGHDWSGEWTVTREATDTEDGKRETTCTRGCGQKKVEVIPATGSTDEGNLQKDAEVAPDAPVEEATMDNKNSELLEAPDIFTPEEKEAIQGGADARVWLEVTRTDESSIPAEDQEKVAEAAEEIMGDNPTITYFDADLFKQVEGGKKTQLHEPGIAIKVTIQIPDDLLNHDKDMAREYKIIRLHTDQVTGESQMDVLSGTFKKATGEFSFETDKFSTYAIVYTDIQLVTGVTLDANAATITTEGGTVQLTATIVPDNAVNKKVIWTTSDPKVATVDENGKVTAVGNGTCIITVTTADGSYTATCTITVNIPSGNSGGNGSNDNHNSNDNNNSNNNNSNTGTDNNNSNSTVSITSRNDGKKENSAAAPATGDNSNVTSGLLLLLLAAILLAEGSVRRKRRIR